MPRSRLIALLLIPMFMVACGREGTAWHGRNIKGVLPNLEFTLTGDGAKAITSADFSGNVVMLYFGFTHCEDVCPVTLTTLTSAVRKLDKDADRVRILFVSVDPARDTPAVLQRYAAHFSPQVVALSGNDVQLKALTKRYRVAYSYSDPDADGNYEVYHSSAIFVFDGQGKVRLLQEEKLGAEAIAEDLRQLIALTGQQINTP